MDDFIENNGSDVNRISQFLLNSWKDGLFVSRNNLQTHIQELSNSSECLVLSESYKRKNYFNDQLLSQSKIKNILQIIEQYLLSALNSTECFPSDSKKLIESLAGDVFCSQDPNDVTNIFLYTMEDAMKEMKIQSVDKKSESQLSQNSDEVQNLIKQWQNEHLKQFLTQKRKEIRYQQLKLKLATFKRRFAEIRRVDNLNSRGCINELCEIDNLLDSVDIKAKQQYLRARMEEENEKLQSYRKRAYECNLQRDSIASIPRKVVKNDRTIQLLINQNEKRRESLLNLRSEIYTDCETNQALADTLQQYISEANGLSKSLLKSVKVLTNESFKCTSSGVPLRCLPQNIMIPLSRVMFDDNSNCEITVASRTPEDLFQLLSNLQKSIHQSKDRCSRTAALSQKITGEFKVLESLKQTDSQLQAESASKLAQRFDRLSQIHHKFYLIFDDIRKLIMETSEMPALTIQLDEEN